MKHYAKLLKNGLPLMVMVLLMSTACEKNDGPVDTTTLRVLEANLLESANLFNSALRERNTEHSFEILDIKRSDNILKVKVRGGGSEELFRFIWDGRIQESHPMGIMLVLKYDNSAGDFDLNNELVISVNLEKILVNAKNLQDYHFYVLNGSKVQQKRLNPDGSVTDK